MYHLEHPKACPKLALDFRLEWFALQLDARPEENGEQDEEHCKYNRREDTLDDALYGRRNGVDPVQEGHGVGEGVDVRDETDKGDDGRPKDDQCDGDPPADQCADCAHPGRHGVVVPDDLRRA